MRKPVSLKMSQNLIDLLVADVYYSGNFSTLRERLKLQVVCWSPSRGRLKSDII